MTRKVSLGKGFNGETRHTSMWGGGEAEEGVQAEATVDPKPSEEARVGAGERAVGGRRGEWELESLAPRMPLKGASLVAQKVKNPPAMRETWVWSLGREDPMEEGMVTHSSILAQETPWTKESGQLQSIGSQKRHD